MGAKPAGAAGAAAGATAEAPANGLHWVSTRAARMMRSKAPRTAPTTGPMIVLVVLSVVVVALGPAVTAHVQRA